MSNRSVARLLAGFALCSSTAHSQTRIFLDQDLNETFGELVAMDAQTITIRRQGMLEKTPRDRWLAMFTAGQAWESVGDMRIFIAGPGVSGGLNQRIEFVDGQRLFGRLVEESGPDQDTILWDVPGFDELGVSLEQISSLRLISSSRADPAVADNEDTVVALNGDVISGFVESMGDALLIDTGSGLLELAWTLVRAVHLTNPQERSIDPVAWLSDGTILGFREGSIDNSSLFTATLAVGDQSSPGEPARGPLISIPSIVIRAISFDPSRVVPLSAISPTSIETIGNRRWAPPVRFGDSATAQLGAAAIVISGPVHVEWPMPDDAIRFAGVALLPENSLLWGDYELVIALRTTGGEVLELSREQLNAQQMMTPFNVPLSNTDTPASAILVTVESGTYGPIQDEVVLKRAIFLLEP